LEEILGGKEKRGEAVGVGKSPAKEKRNWNGYKREISPLPKKGEGKQTRTHARTLRRGLQSKSGIREGGKEKKAG